MICLVCKGTSFYEDSESSLCCRDCGFQSQDYIRESNDINDGLAHLVGPTKTERLSFITKKVNRYQRKSRKPKGTTLLEFLLAYQKCLIVMTKSIPYHSNSFIKYIQYLWSEYLIVWMNSNCPMLDCIYRHPNCNYDFLGENFRGNNDVTMNKHPLTPSIPLLLGFIYLACRQQRLPILVQDIVRWINEGLIPYNNLWPYAKSLSLKLRHKVFFKRMFKPPTASNIIFHFNCLSNSLNISVAPLNSPLMARCMIIDMAFPPNVWHSYCKLFQVLKDNDVFAGVDTCNQHHSEHLFVQLIMACKFSKNWMNWKLLKSSNKKYHFKPQTLYELSDCSRQELKVLIENLSRNKRDTDDDHTIFNFNDAIKNYVTLGLNKDVLEDCIFSNDVKSNELFHTGSCMFGAHFNEYRYYKFHELDGPSSNMNSQYFIYSGDDHSGVYSLNVVTIIERLAKYACTKSGLIFEILKGVEQNIIDFKASRNPVTDMELCQDNSNINAMFESKLQKLKVLQIKQNAMLPTVKLFGSKMSLEPPIDAFIDQFRPGEFDTINDEYYGLKSEKSILQGKLYLEKDVSSNTGFTMKRKRVRHSSSYLTNDNDKQKYLRYLNTPPSL